MYCITTWRNKLSFHSNLYTFLWKIYMSTLKLQCTSMLLGKYTVISNTKNTMVINFYSIIFLFSKWTISKLFYGNRTYCAFQPKFDNISILMYPNELFFFSKIQVCDRILKGLVNQNCLKILPQFINEMFWKWCKSEIRIAYVHFLSFIEKQSCLFRKLTWTSTHNIIRFQLASIGAQIVYDFFSNVAAFKIEKLDCNASFSRLNVIFVTKQTKV